MEIMRTAAEGRAAIHTRFATTTRLPPMNVASVRSARTAGSRKRWNAPIMLLTALKEDVDRSALTAYL
jgi:hypothetical protein